MLAGCDRLYADMLNLLSGQNPPAPGPNRMPLTKADVQTIRDAETAHRAAVAAVAERAADPSVTVVKNADGTTTALVRAGGKFKEIFDVRFVDMGAKP